MVYPDTNILVYMSVNQGDEKNSYKNFNDAIHVKIAEKHCRKLVTYDSDFKKFKDKSQLEIEILK